jgi:hypothetical protein
MKAAFDFAGWFKRFGVWQHVHGVSSKIRMQRLSGASLRPELADMADKEKAASTGGLWMASQNALV